MYTYVGVWDIYIYMYRRTHTYMYIPTSVSTLGWVGPLTFCVLLLILKIFCVAIWWIITILLTSIMPLANIGLWLSCSLMNVSKPKSCRNRKDLKKYFEYLALLEASFASEWEDKFLVGVYACFQYNNYLKAKQLLSAALKSSPISHVIFRIYLTDEAIRLSSQIKNSGTV